MNGAEVLLYDTSSAQGVLQQTYHHGSDPVHGPIVLGPLCSLATSTAPVFRLRKLTQLGPTCFGPYPAVEHTRFPHCLGVAHLARQCVQHLAEAGADDVSPLDIELTSLAGVHLSRCIMLLVMASRAALSILPCIAVAQWYQGFFVCASGVCLECGIAWFPADMLAY